MDRGSTPEHAADGTVHADGFLCSGYQDSAVAEPIEPKFEIPLPSNVPDDYGDAVVVSITLLQSLKPFLDVYFTANLAALSGSHDRRNVDACKFCDLGKFEFSR